MFIAMEVGNNFQALFTFFERLSCTSSVAKSFPIIFTAQTTGPQCG